MVNSVDHDQTTPEIRLLLKDQSDLGALFAVNIGFELENSFTLCSCFDSVESL